MEPMTDKQKLVELFTKFGFKFYVCDTQVSILVNDRDRQQEKIVGYDLFCCEFDFNDDGSFKQVGVWE